MCIVRRMGSCDAVWMAMGRKYRRRAGQYSVTAKVTIVVTASCSVVAPALCLLYNTVMLKLVKRRHEGEVRAAERDDDHADDDV